MITLPFFGGGGGGSGKNWSWNYTSDIGWPWCWYDGEESFNFTSLGLATVEKSSETVDFSNIEKGTLTAKLKITIKKDCLLVVGDEMLIVKVGKYNRTTKKNEGLVYITSVGPDFTDAWGETELGYNAAVPFLGLAGDVFFDCDGSPWTFFQLSS